MIFREFPELLILEPDSRKKISRHDDNNVRAISLTNLVARLLDTKFFKIDEEDGDALIFKFNTSRERIILYNFLPSYLKQQYHLYAAKTFIERVNSTSNPNPSLIYELGTHFYLGNDLRNSLLCYYHYGDFLHSIGANKDALPVFEHAYKICCELFKNALNDDLSDVHALDKKAETLSSLADGSWTDFSRYSLEEMHRTCSSSNIQLFAIISIIIRYGQILINSSKRFEASQILRLAIQLFVSSRSTINSEAEIQEIDVIADTKDHRKPLYCQYPTENLAFVENTKFLVNESRINVERKLLNKTQLFGIMAEELESIFPIISGFFVASIGVGYHNQKLGELEGREMYHKILDGVITACCTNYSPCHYMRFMNTKHMYHRVGISSPSSPPSSLPSSSLSSSSSSPSSSSSVNSPELLHSGLSIADVTLGLYEFDKHSNTIVSLYGCDWASESIVLGILYIFHYHHHHHHHHHHNHHHH